tara:strand:- start:5608 stop:6165 length:558 start_codon:yes stop_codon:yes gene_type:complete
MGKLSRSDILEAVFWLLIAVIFFAVSFSFNQPIEIYKFGATGWPRVILFLMALVSLGNLYHAYSKGAKAQEGRVGAKENDEPIEYTSIGQYLKTGMILLLPLLYALALKPVGFYSGTPIFIALIMIAWGERRVRFILINTVLIYAILIGLFMFVLNAPLPQGNMSPFYDISAFMLKTKTQLDQMF